ncbi:histidine phosphatase family protein [Paenisporosarcina sp. TG20]|uniref:histidine phosphatase family protein n=1 Tax=Paenisporosarcina sp. TG20 TaxID=1211706 RepID=UPI00030E7955|nr:histidine phosphatase family protein [Paenisporosarcina sp. TG20]
MKRIYLVRHCSATGQVAEAELTESGYNQANMLASFFKNIVIDHIISSPFTRAQQSITPTVRTKNLSLIIDNRLAERTLSTSDLPNWLELLEETFTNFDLKLTGGESSREATLRAIEVVNEAPDNSILVTHGNLMSLILKHFDDSLGFSEWKSLSNPDIYKITLINNENTIKHLWNN